jgi:hypothetical protein
MSLQIPDDPNITAYEKKKTELAVLWDKREEVTTKKQQAPQAFLLAQRSSEHALIDADGRDLSPATFEEDQRQLDAREASLLREIKQAEADLEPLRRARRKVIVTANRGRFLDLLRRRARALVEVAKLNQLEAEFHLDMQSADVSSGLRPMGVAVGDWRDEQSMARFHIKELREHFPEFKDEGFER